MTSTIIAVTGATGNLGRLVIGSLLDGGADPSTIVAAARSPEKADGLAARGVQVRQADYTRPDTLRTALAGVDRLLLISSSEVGQRFNHHRNVVEAAEEADVGFLAYTSIVHADTNPMELATAHRRTEEVIRESGIPFSLLRNSWYIENYTATIDQILENGAIYGSAGEGRISGATRADYASAAAAVMTSGDHDGAVYELGGDEAFTMSGLAAVITRQSGTDVDYHDLPQDEYAKLLVEIGLPEAHAATLADADVHIREGHLFVDTGDLRTLIGRPTTKLSDAVADALSG